MYPDATIGKLNVIKERGDVYRIYQPDRFYNRLIISVIIKNLAYNKVVKIVYTMDNWNTVQEGFASMKMASKYDVDLEHWEFMRDVDGFQGTIQYCIAYEVNGQTYWDNNDGQNYSITVE